MLISHHFFQFDLPQYSNCSYGDYVQVGSISFHVVTKSGHLVFLAPGPRRQCDRAGACNSVWCGSNPLCGHLWQQCQVTPHCTGRCPHSKLRLIFHADGADQEKRGFLVKINASVEGGCLDDTILLVQSLMDDSI